MGKQTILGMHRESTSASGGPNKAWVGTEGQLPFTSHGSGVGEQVQVVTAIHIKAADPRGGVAGPDHLRQRPHLLHLGGYPVGVWETLLQKEGSVAMGLSLAAPSLRAPERPRWAKGPPS